MRKNIVEMEFVSCNLCNADDWEAFFEKPDLSYFVDQVVFRVVRCKRCSLCYVNPRPAYEDMQRYYPEEFYKHLKEKIHLERYRREVEYLSDISPAKLLDIGCGNGNFLLLMKKKGWQVWGQEVSFNNDRCGEFPIYNKPLPVCGFESNFFDAVTAWAVMEHLHDPMSYFREVSRILKPGGRFIFLVTNSNSLASSRLYEEDIPRHLYLFSKSTVELYLEKVSLSLKKVEFSRNSYSMSYRGILFYFLKSIVGEKYEWRNKEFFYKRCCAVNNKEDTIFRKLQFSIRHPLYALDAGIISRIAEIVAIIRKNYGIMIVTAQKAK